MNSVYGVIVRSIFDPDKHVNERVCRQTRSRVSSGTEVSLVTLTWTIRNVAWEHASGQTRRFL